jgi:hydroxypyruvate reductase/glycerate 2-kinase
MSSSPLRQHAQAIWQAAVAAVDPFTLVRDALAHPDDALGQALEGPGQLLIVGGGKAGAAMAAGVEEALADRLDRVRGIINIPADTARPLRSIRLHSARPAGTNQPTAEGVTGVETMLDLVAKAGPDDAGLCLLSGGGSALLPAPVVGISLAAKQKVTALLHACGATIDEMNCVRKHLSRVKGGQLAQALRGRPLFSLILSDVVGDPLDVIASGPTAADPTTFAHALAVLDRYRLRAEVPHTILSHLQRGLEGVVPETPKALPGSVHNRILGNNTRALAAATKRAGALDYTVVNLGSFLEGETHVVAGVHAAIVRSIRSDTVPVRPPACLLSGGETTVTLGDNPGKGGRNQEFVLAALLKLGAKQMDRTVILSGGTDGEDGPTDAAGAVADSGTLSRAAACSLEAIDHLRRHDAYPFFDATGDLLQTGLTGTNVMDVRVVLVGS